MGGDTKTCIMGVVVGKIMEEQTQAVSRQYIYSPRIVQIAYEGKSLVALDCNGKIWYKSLWDLRGHEEWVQVEGPVDTEGSECLNRLRPGPK